MKYILNFALMAVLLGCGQRESAVVVQPSASEEPADPGKSQPPETAKVQNGGAVTTPAPVETPRTPEVPTMFEYPTDLTGKAVVKAVAPETPALTPTERFGMAPRPRALPAKILNPEPIARASDSLPPILPAKSVGVKISLPPEKVPLDFGRGSDAVPARPTLPVAAVVTERARDVNIPPAMPTLGRPLHERVGLDDPTSEFGNAAIVAPGVNVPLKSADFLKVSLPDPFELGEQVKPKIPAAAEPGLSPAPVNPQRVK